MSLQDHFLSFGFDLFTEIVRDDPNRSVIISPLSISLALSVALNGAGGETRQAMAKALRVQNMPIEELNRANASLLAALKDIDSEARVSTASALWARKDAVFKQDFLRLSTELYKAQAENIDFEGPGVIDAINEWVNRMTQGKIAKIVDESVVDENRIFLILNAVYFKGVWHKAFERSRTREEIFTLSSGRQKKHPMMFQEGCYRYYRGEDFQAVRLPYGYGRMSMYVFLPDERTTLEEFHKRLNARNWNHWISCFREMEGTIGLPRFKEEYDTDLNDVLISMGMGIAFDPVYADFGNIFSARQRAWIDAVKHKAFLEVNEEGTEAAGVTAALMEEEMPSDETFTMMVNRPFFLAIRDSGTGTVLFMGSIVDPGKTGAAQ